MTSTTADPYKIGHDGRDADATGRGGGGPAAPRIYVAYGFWIFLLSDIIMFAALFAAYAVLMDRTDGGPAGATLFSLGNAAAETALLLLSTCACGIATVAAARRRPGAAQAALLVTALLGLGFLALEVREFAGLIARGAGPQRSAFLSAFFALVGCHGLHVTAGLVWIALMVPMIRAKGLRDDVLRRLACFSLFWHALDIIWVALLIIVYIMGARG